MAGELVQLDEGALVQEEFDALAGGEFALGVLLLHGALRAGVGRLLDTPLQIRELARGRTDVDVDLLALFRLGHRDRGSLPAQRGGRLLTAA